MLTRLTHAAIAFAVTAVVYQAYVLAVVPFVEPRGASMQPALALAPTRCRHAAREALDRYRELLAAYFPPDHWCFAEPPKTFENGQALIVFDEYQQSTAASCACRSARSCSFPRPRNRAAPPPRDAIILEPSGGAVLQMDQRSTRRRRLRPHAVRTARRGDVRSDMREPGPQDDLLITPATCT